jgi:hypothetical protein
LEKQVELAVKKRNQTLLDTVQSQSESPHGTTSSSGIMHWTNAEFGQMDMEGNGESAATRRRSDCGRKRLGIWKSSKLNRTTNVLCGTKLKNRTTMEKKLEAQDERLPVGAKIVATQWRWKALSSSAQGTQSYLHSAGRD